MADTDSVWVMYHGQYYGLQAFGRLIPDSIRIVGTSRSGISLDELAVARERTGLGYDLRVTQLDVPAETADSDLATVAAQLLAGEAKFSLLTDSSRLDHGDRRTPRDANQELRTISVINLVPAMLNDVDPQHVEFAREVQRRWAGAAAQKALAIQGFGQPNWQGPSPDVDRSLIEQARQYLAMQTLIYELWVFQEAGVEPNALWADPDAATRVFRVIEREHARASAHLGPNGELLDLPDPYGAGAKNLARWVDLAVFGDEQYLIEDQYRLAGSMDGDLLAQHVELCAQALAELGGPWSLDAFLTDPVGREYYRAQPAMPRDGLAGLDVALGRRGQAITTDEVAAIVMDTDMAIDAQARSVASHGVGESPPEIDPSKVPREHLIGVLGELRQLDQFLSEALAVRQLAADTIARVDGRPVPRDMLPRVMGWHREAAGRFPPRLPGPITVAGIQVTFAKDPVFETAAIANVAGRTKKFAMDNLGGLLTILDQPAEDALTAIAKIRVHIDRLDHHLATSSTNVARQPTTRARREVTPVRPDTWAQQRGPAVLPQQDGRSR